MLFHLTGGLLINMKLKNILSVDHPFEVAKIIAFLGSLFIIIPTFSDPVYLPKVIATSLVSTMFFTLTCLKVLFFQKKFVFRWSILTISLGLFFLLSLISTLTTDGNIAESTIAPFGILTFAPVLLLLLSIQTYLTKKDLALIEKSFLLFTIVTNIQLIFSVISTHTLLSIPLLSTYLAPVVLNLISISILIRTYNPGKKHWFRTAVKLGCIIFCIITLSVSLFKYGTPLVESYQPLFAQYSIMTSSYTSFKQLLFGISAERYIDFSSQFLPRELLNTKWWNIRFQFAHFFPFHIGTILGLAGLINVFFFLGSVGYVAYSHTSKLSKIIILCLIIGLLLHPTNTALFLLITIFAFLYETKYFFLYSNISFRSVRIAFIGLTIISVGILYTAIVGSYSIYKAEQSSSSMRLAIANGDGLKASQLSTQAITYFPMSSLYYRQSSQLYQSLLLSLLEESRLETITIQDQQLLQQLISQAIDDAQKAQLLHPSLNNLVNIGMLYRNLIGVADNAQLYALYTYQEITKKDPLNIIHLLTYAELLEVNNDLVNAELTYQLITSLKPDYLPAWDAFKNYYERTQQTEKSSEVDRIIKTLNTK